MMSDVDEHEPRPPIRGSEPAADPSPVDPDHITLFHEFQRFQAYLRFVRQGEETTPGQPPAHGAEIVPVDGRLPPAPPAADVTDLHQQLTSMRQQLAEMRASQERVERVVNPPLWRKVLRNPWLHRALVLLVLAILALWGVPALVQHYVGPHEDAVGPSAALPAPKSQSHELPPSPNDAVHDVYLFVGGGQAQQACFLFDQTAAAQFARAAGAANCAQAVLAWQRQVTDAASYRDPNLRALPAAPAGATTVTISSCSFRVSGGPPLGTFTLTRQSDGTWEITGYQPITQCP